MPGRAWSLAASASHLAQSVFLGALRALRRRLVRRGRVVACGGGRAILESVRSLEPCLAEAAVGRAIACLAGGRSARQARRRIVRPTARGRDPAGEPRAPRCRARLPRGTPQTSGRIRRRRRIARGARRASTKPAAKNASQIRAWPRGSGSIRQPQPLLELPFELGAAAVPAPPPLLSEAPAPPRLDTPPLELPAALLALPPEPAS